MEMLDKLKDIVGSENVIDDPEILLKYSKDQSFVRPCRPDLVLYVKNVGEIQKVVAIANEYQIPIIPFSSGMNLHGGTIPDQGGIILNLSKMNTIEEIKKPERWVVIEPGVTYAQLCDELEKHDLRVMIPLGTPPSRSVISSIMDGEPSIAAANFEYGNSLYMDMEMVLPTGEIYRLGNWMALVNGKWGMPGGGGIFGLNEAHPFLWQGAQGTLGIITKLVVKTEHLSKIRKVFFISFHKLEDAIEPIRRIQRRAIGLECFLLNKFNLAAIGARDWTVPDTFPCERVSSTDFEGLRTILPKWTLIISIAGLPYLPEEKVAYEEADLIDVCEELNVIPENTAGNVEGLGEIMAHEILRPWGVLKKAHYRGSFHTIAFYTTLDKLPEFERLIYTLAEKYGYINRDISGYVLPIEQGRCCYFEFDFHCDLSDPRESSMVKDLWLEANRACSNIGGVLAKPYGPCAEIVYRRMDPTYVEKLRMFKKEMDPHNIMNPGKLCFQG